MTTAVSPAAVKANLSRPPLPALTGLRTLLALSIVFFHFTPPHMEILAPIFNNGFVFVGFFFLLSGFILAYNYADRPNLSKRDFWVARFSRLYPVYLAALVISYQMLASEWGAHSRAEFWQGFLLTPLLLQGWFPNLATFWNTVAWTLSCEFMLYLAFPWLVRIPLPRRESRRERRNNGCASTGRCLTPRVEQGRCGPERMLRPSAEMGCIRVMTDRRRCCRRQILHRRRSRHRCRSWRSRL